MKTISTKTIIIAYIVVAILFVFTLAFSFQPQKAQSSIGDSSYGYQATTTKSAVLGVTLTSPQTLSLGFGVLGSVIITGKNTGTIYIYDATSTNAHSDYVGTTTLAIIPSNAPEGTYTFDALYTRGLVVESSGLVATSTITWKK